MRGLITVILLILTAQPAFATITGTVTDTDGNPIPRALVMFTSEPDSTVVLMAVTDSTGQYELGDSTTGVAEEQPQLFTLGENYPNPFNPATSIPFFLDAPGHVSLTIYNIMGQRIRTLIDGYLTAGNHTLVWDACDNSGNKVGSGAYLYHLRYGSRTETKKMLLLDSGGMSGSASAPLTSQSSAYKEASAPVYSISVERFPYVAIRQAYVSVASDTYDFALQNAGLMVEIPGGTFQMGDSTALYDIDPVHEVFVSDFEMCKYEVTNEQYCAFLNTLIVSGEVDIIDDGDINVYGKSSVYYCCTYRVSNPYQVTCRIEYLGRLYRIISKYKKWPFVMGTWFGAKAFANYYGYDLPTEAEWEYACRGGMQYEYGTDDGTIDASKAKYNSSSSLLSQPCDVGSYPPNPFGVYDLSGNVFEWCNDWYAYYSENQEGLDEMLMNPTGPATGESKIMRGGHYNSFWRNCKSSYRFSAPPEEAPIIAGFRVVRRPDGTIYE